MKRFLMISTATAARGEIRVKTGFAHRLIGVTVCLFALATAGVGQVTESWDALYNGVDHPAYDDLAAKLAVDTAGNVYVTGYSFGGQETYWDWAAALSASVCLGEPELSDDPAPMPGGAHWYFWVDQSKVVIWNPNFGASSILMTPGPSAYPGCRILQGSSQRDMAGGGSFLRRMANT
ncbi:MAG: SBBP repeat-containing protein [Fimbriimonadales bacterium]